MPHSLSLKGLLRIVGKYEASCSDVARVMIGVGLAS
jgi:hypothetical protein